MCNCDVQDNGWIPGRYLLCREQSQVCVQYNDSPEISRTLSLGDTVFSFLSFYFTHSKYTHEYVVLPPLPNADDDEF